jgi:hypothetical protein
MVHQRGLQRHRLQRHNCLLQSITRRYRWYMPTQDSVAICAPCVRGMSCCVLQGMTIAHLLACSGRAQELQQLMDVLFRMQGDGVETIRR